MRESVRNIGKTIGIALAVYVGIRWLLPLAAPFFAAAVLAKFLNPAITVLERRLRLRRNLCASVLIGIFLLLIGTALFFFLRAFFGQVRYVLANLGEYQSQAADFWHECCCRVENVTGIKAKLIEGSFEAQMPNMLKRAEENFLPAVMGGTVSYAKNLFAGIGICFVAVVSTILVIKDYQKIRSGLEQRPVGRLALQVCRRTYEAGGAYIRSQAIILAAVAAVCVLGLYLSGNKYALLAGCGIGICDAMPFLGTGTVFVPWAVLEMMQGKYMLAAVYAFLYTVCSLIREILEPKLLGDRLGMHPLAVVASIYVGLGAYGLWGFLLGPLSYILIREIYLTI